MYALHGVFAQQAIFLVLLHSLRAASLLCMELVF
jgi:hypothetical protein